MFLIFLCIRNVQRRIRCIIHKILCQIFIKSSLISKYSSTPGPMAIFIGKMQVVYSASKVPETALVECFEHRCDELLQLKLLYLGQEKTLFTDDLKVSLKI